MDLPVVGLSLSLLGFGRKERKKKIFNIFLNWFFKPIFIKSFMGVGLGCGILMFLCLHLSLLLILLHPEGMFYLCVPYHSFPPALLPQPMSPSPWLSLPMEHRVPAGSRAPRRRLFASAPTGIVPTHLPQIQSSIYRCFLVTGAIILKIIWGVKLLLEQQSEGQDRKYNVWRCH